MKRTGVEADYRRALALRLREKSAELESLILDRISALGRDSEQSRRSLEGRRLLIRALVEYGAVAVERGERKCPPPPPAVQEHAREAAWSGVPPRIFHERYLAAKTVFNRFLRREAPSVEGFAEGLLAQVQESNDIVFERLFRFTGEELERERQKKRRSTATQQLERVQALLAGKLLEAPELSYDFESTHVGIVATGEGVSSHVRRTARSLGGQLLLAQPAPQRYWAWIGLRVDPSSAKLEDALLADCPPAARISLGEPGHGLAGWRRTHREAEAALPVADQRNQAIIRYSDVMVLAEMLSNDLLRGALESKYLAPLAVDRDGGELSKHTLRAYFSQNRQISSAATLLGVKRHTVRKRLDDVEARLGLAINSCAAELELALRIEALVPPSAGQ